MDEKDKLIQELRRELANCRDELCAECGKYKTSYLGVCDSCRYAFGKAWSKL